MKVSINNYDHSHDGEELDERCADLERGEIVDEWNGVEGRSEMPPQLGAGGGRYFKLRNGLWLVLDDYTWHDSMQLDVRHDQFEWLTAFYLSGCIRTVTPNVPGVSDDYLEVDGQNSLFFLPDLREVEHSPAGQQQRIIKIYLEPDFFSAFSTGFDALPVALRQLAEGNLTQRFYQHLGTTTPAMRQVLLDILSCPFKGVLKQMYLEGKALELVVLQLGHWLKDGKHLFPPNWLRAEDLNRLHQAKEILTHKLHNPPSLLDLARQVELNDYKLKRGFREVFGTTVLRYVQSLRLHEAKRLLADRQLSVAVIAHTVGYSSQSHFCYLFKREFGQTPREYRNHLGL